MKKVKVTKVTERSDASISLDEAINLNPFRDLVHVGRSFVGNYDEIPVPEVDMPFFFQGISSENCLRTSIVKEVLEQNETKVIFKTMNSIYQIEVETNA